MLGDIILFNFYIYISAQAVCFPLTGLVIGLCKVKVSPLPLAGKTLETKVTASETTPTMSFTTGEHTCLSTLFIYISQEERGSAFARYD